MNRSVRQGVWLGLLALAACSQNGGAGAPAVGGPGAPAAVAPAPQASGAPTERLILIDDYPIDTTQPEAMYSLLPGRLRTGDMRDALAGLAAPRGGLYLIQFTGPVLEDGLRQVAATGAEIVSYIPFNAYVVRADATAARALAGLVG